MIRHNTSYTTASLILAMLVIAALACNLPRPSFLIESTPVTTQGDQPGEANSPTDPPPPTTMPSPSPTSRLLASDFILTTFEGQEYILFDLRGQVVVLNFWASWCVYCANEAPDFQAAWEAYRGQGVMFLGIAVNDYEARSLDYIASHGITYPNGPDKGQRIARDYGVWGLPQTYIVNRLGEVAYTAMTELSYDRLSAEIEQALAQ